MPRELDSIDGFATGSALRPLLERAVPGAELVGSRELGVDDAAQPGATTEKSIGYGVPIRLDVLVAGERRSYVLHRARPNRFGHERRADRAAELLLAADTFPCIPGHTRVLDVGALRADGTTVSLKDAGEFYLLTEFAPGRLYAEDLRRLAARPILDELDVERTRRLAAYLVALHHEKPDVPFAYERSLRDLLGSGEGVFGIVDAYPPTGAGFDRETLRRIEALCHEFRWRMKLRPARLARIHGDFHPFNLLFDDASELRLLDASRGCLGDPADDVACLAINYVFFALGDRGAWRAAFSRLWYELWSRYTAASGDSELCDVVGPFLAWRSLVLACPVWYPDLGASERRALLDFAERALRADRFDPAMAEAVFQ